jgi:hypothetical protein
MNFAHITYLTRTRAPRVALHILSQSCNSPGHSTPDAQRSLHRIACSCFGLCSALLFFVGYCVLTPKCAASCERTRHPPTLP